MELDRYIRDRITDQTKRYYGLIDEIQFVSEIQNPYVDAGVVEYNCVDENGILFICAEQFLLDESAIDM